MASATYSRVVGSRVTVEKSFGGLRVISKVQLEDLPVITAADSMRTRVATALLRTVEVVKDAISLKDLAEKLQVADLNGVLEVLNLDKRFEAAARGAGLQPDETSFLEAIKDVWAAGARAELDSLNTVPIRKASVPDTVGMALSFDLLNPDAVAFLSTYVMNLIREVSDETRRAIADVVMNAFQYGGHPYEQARTIRNMIGLTQTQSKAVANFRNMLVNEPLMALTRDLRDHRFDSTLQNIGRLKGQLTQEQIDRMSDRYYERYLKYRAEMIARTETIRAARYGQEETWRQAIKQGLLPQDMKRKWIVTRDDRLCKHCRSIPKLNPAGRGMDEQFLSDIGPVDGPPLHPHCRCALAKKVDWGVSKAEEIEKFNPCHNPAGSSEGGQFCETETTQATHRTTAENAKRIREEGFSLERFGEGAGYGMFEEPAGIFVSRYGGKDFADEVSTRGLNMQETLHVEFPKGKIWEPTSEQRFAKSAEVQRSWLVDRYNVTADQAAFLQRGAVGRIKAAGLLDTWKDSISNSAEVDFKKFFAQRLIQEGYVAVEWLEPIHHVKQTLVLDPKTLRVAD